MADRTTSRFRHVFGEVPKTDKCFTSLKISKGPLESNMSAVNSKFVAYCMESQGGGSFMVIPVDKPCRVDINYPKVNGHRNAVLDIQWNPFNDNELASASEDCDVKIWTIPDGGIRDNMDKDAAKMVLSGHGKKVTRLAWHPSAANILATGGFDKQVIIWNLETEERIAYLKGFNGDFNNFSWSYNGRYMAVSSKDPGRGVGQRLMVYNVRKEEIMQETISHEGTKPSHCVFLGATNMILTTGFTKQSDRQYSLWNAGDLTKSVFSEKVDTSSGVLMPFWDEDTKMFYLIGKGDTVIRYFEVMGQKSKFLSQLLGSIPHRGACMLPKRHTEYMRCEVARFYRLQHTKGIIEPLPFIVPRKSDMFQDDVFNTCFAGEPALTAEEWAGKKNPKGEYEVQPIDKDPKLLKFTRDGLVPVSDAEAKVSTDIQFKSAEPAPKKAQPEVHKRFGSPPPESGHPAVLVTLDDYKRAYSAQQKEIESLKKEIAELKAKSA